MKMNQKGFGLVEGLLIAMLVVVLAFSGWYIWNENQDEDSTTESTTSTDASSQLTAETEAEPTIPEGWVQYSNDLYGFSFIYPEEWGEAVSGRFNDGDTYYAETFSNNGSLIFGAPLREYTSPGRGGVLTDPTGFIERDGED